MTVDYRVELTIGPYSWTINRGDPPAFPAGVDVLDNLRIGWSMPETDLWPPQPNPTNTAFSLLAAAADQLDAVDTNTPVSLLIYTGLTHPETDEPMPSVRFAGQVAELTGQPFYAGGQLAWRLDVQCVDTIAPLADENVAATLGETDTGGPFGWVYVYFLIAGIPAPDWGLGGNGCELAPAPGGHVKSDSLLAAVDAVLARYADGGPLFGPEDDPANHALYDYMGWRRGILVPNLGPDHVVDPDTPYAIEWVARRSLTTMLNPLEPGTLAYAGGVWSVVLTPPPATTWDPVFAAEATVNDFGVLIDADYVDLGATWSRSKFLDPNRCVVTSNEEAADYRKVVRRTPGPRPDPYQDVTAQVSDVRILESWNARHLGDMYVSDAYDNLGNRYQAQSFTWYASSDPQFPILRGLFPDNSLAEGSLWRGFAAPITIAGIPAEQSPNGSRWYTGTLKAVDWVFAGGEFAILLNLYPRIPRQARIEPTSYDGLATLDPPPTYATVNPADTWTDYRLIRPIGTDYPLGP